jgi:hypothetical protein
MARMSGNHSPKARRKLSAVAPLNSISAPERSKARTSKTGIWPKPKSSANQPLTPFRRAVVVKVQGVIYPGEYESSFGDGYIPGEWKPGDPVPVRLALDKL